MSFIIKAKTLIEGFLKRGPVILFGILIFSLLAQPLTSLAQKKPTTDEIIFKLRASIRVLANKLMEKGVSQEEIYNDINAIKITDPYPWGSICHMCSNMLECSLLQCFICADHDCSGCSQGCGVLLTGPEIFTTESL